MKNVGIQDVGTEAGRRSAVYSQVKLQRCLEEVFAFATLLVVVSIPKDQRRVRPNFCYIICSGFWGPNCCSIARSCNFHMIHIRLVQDSWTQEKSWMVYPSPSCPSLKRNSFVDVENVLASENHQGPPRTGYALDADHDDQILIV